MPEDSPTKTDAPAAAGQEAGDQTAGDQTAGGQTAGDQEAAAGQAAGQTASAGQASGQEATSQAAASQAAAAGQEAAAKPAAKPAKDSTSSADASLLVSDRASRKQRSGVVVSTSMDRTAVVLLTERVRHRSYGKIVGRRARLYVHDANNELGVGDKVRVVETRPLSKKKRWRLVEILERAR